MHKLIGFHGCKGVGKDTAADFLVLQHNYHKLPFAKPLKQAVANLFGISLAQVEHYKDNKGNTIDLVNVLLEICGSDGKKMTQYDYSWREFLQRFGTEMGRKTFGEDFWVDLWIEKYIRAYASDMVCVTDVRFTNEAKAIASMGGVVVHIKRPGHEPDGHDSENELPGSWIDYLIVNDGDLEQFHRDVIEVAHDD